MNTAQKYLMADALQKGKGLYRLTLTAEAFAVAVQKSKPMAGFNAMARSDGKWDTMVSTATANQLNQLREEGEHLTDVVMRLLTPKAVQS